MSVAAVVGAARPIADPQPPVGLHRGEDDVERSRGRQLAHSPADRVDDQPIEQATHPVQVRTRHTGGEFAQRPGEFLAEPEVGRRLRARGDEERPGLVDG